MYGFAVPVRLVACAERRVAPSRSCQFDVTWRILRLVDSGIPFGPDSRVKVIGKSASSRGVTGHGGMGAGHQGHTTLLSRDLALY